MSRARIASHSVSGGEDQFRDGVRARDGRCVISGQINLGAPWDDWAGLESAHVFPLEKESLWVQLGYGRLITTMDDTSVEHRINSIQNGLLMSAHFHTRFDQYLFSINPDVSVFDAQTLFCCTNISKDGCKIVEFGLNSWGIDGRTLDPVCRNPATRDHVLDELLRWHFRQAVLANMRGAGEPLVKSDFPPGSDMMATLREELYGKERFEMELESRLRPGTTNS